MFEESIQLERPASPKAKQGRRVIYSEIFR